MTDNIPEPIVETPPPNPPVSPAPLTPPSPKRSKKALWIILAILLLCCLSTILCLALGGASFARVILEKAPIASVLDAFMQDMAAKDADRAYALFSPRSQRQTPLADLEAMLQGNNYKLFEGYLSLSVNQINLSAAVNTDPDAPQGNVASVSGTVTYNNGFTGSFTAVLEKVDGVWMLYGIDIRVPPDKFPSRQGALVEVWGN
jgi:hypothetical protein